jgi:hypothetical protein
MNPVNQLSSIIVLLWDSSQEYDWVTKSITTLALDLREGGPDTEELWSESTTHPSYGEYCLADLIIGAYWHYADYHGGQGSLGYRALSALSLIYSPSLSERRDGSSSLAHPERECCQEIYNLLTAHCSGIEPPDTATRTVRC